MEIFFNFLYPHGLFSFLQKKYPGITEYISKKYKSATKSTSYARLVQGLTKCKSSDVKENIHFRWLNSDIYTAIAACTVLLTITILIDENIITEDTK